MGIISDACTSALVAPEPSALDLAFTELPVPLTVFVQDAKYLGNPPLSPIQYDALRHAERIYYQPTYELLQHAPDPVIVSYWAEPVRLCNLITLQWGKGSGKDHICRLASLRIAYLLLCLRSPQEYYEMPAQDTIHLLNVASSSRQASRAFFQPMRKMVTRPGGWFGQQGVEVHEVARGPRARRAQGGVQALMDTIRFTKGIEAISGHSDAETQEGLNLMLGIADEIDAFRRKEELARYHGAQERESTRSAEGIIDMLKSSARTRFPQVFKNIYISYPRYKGSMIQILTKEANVDMEKKGQRSATFGSGPHSTWQVNPRVRGKEDFQDDYDKDPIMAAAKYECKPSRALNPYFTNEIAIDAAEVEVEQYPVSVSYELKPDGRAWRPVYDFSAALQPIQGAIYAMHADLAVTGDRAGIALSHVARQDEFTVYGEDERGGLVGVSETRPYVKVDFVASFSADAGKSPAREIQIRWARNLCLELRRRGFNIRRFTCDGFQSVDTLQILETQYGIETDSVSTDKRGSGDAIWQNLRDLFSEGRIEMPERQSVHDELLGLSRLPNGKIDHLAGGSKDEADALACSVHGAVICGGAEDPDGRRSYLAGGDWPMGLPLGDLPLGFQPPSPLEYGEVQRHHVLLDGMGRPVPVVLVDEDAETEKFFEGAEVVPERRK